MLFCLTAEYTPQALNAMRENPNTNRREAATQLLEAAGGKLIEMYHTANNGPGAMVIFDVPDPAMAPAICGVAVSSGSVQNVQMKRLFTMDEIKGIRQNAAKIRRLTSALASPIIQASQTGGDPSICRVGSACRAGARSYGV
jgi:uncharacterized protein with GYD domain